MLGQGKGQAEDNVVGTFSMTRKIISSQGEVDITEFGILEKRIVTRNGVMGAVFGDELYPLNTRCVRYPLPDHLKKAMEVYCSNDELSFGEDPFTEWSRETVGEYWDGVVAEVLEVEPTGDGSLGIYRDLLMRHDPEHVQGEMPEWIELEMSYVVVDGKGTQELLREHAKATVDCFFESIESIKSEQ